MKKRMTALVTALLVTMLCLPFYLFTTGTVVNAFYYKNDDLGRFGPNEEYVIVPMNARNSALTFDTPAEGSKSTTFSLKTKDEYYTNQIWVVRKVGDYYAFECKGTGMVVGIPGGKAVENTALQVHKAQEWSWAFRAARQLKTLHFRCMNITRQMHCTGGWKRWRTAPISFTVSSMIIFAGI